jgi:hypothetical protein
MKRRFVLVPCALLALTVGVASAMAGGGNSANAHACQMGGWRSLFDANGGTFASQDACVSYGARGGTIYTTNPNPFPQSKNDCESHGGTFATGTGLTLWSCNGWLITRGSGDLPLDCFRDAAAAGDRGDFGPAFTDPTVPSDSNCTISL